MVNPEFFNSLEYTDADQLVEGKFADIKFDMVIGSDVIYWPQSIVPLCNVLNTLFTNKPDLVFYVCYIERSQNTHKSLL